MEDCNSRKMIVVAGHISLDITPAFQNTGKMKIDELFRPGKLVRVGGARISPGGSVSNTGLALHRLGADVLLMSMVGNDCFGGLLRENIIKQGCKTCIRPVDSQSTSYTVVVAPRGMDRFFLHDPGCNDTFCCEDVDMEQVKQASHFHFGYPTLMQRFYEDEGRELERLFKTVKGLGLTTSLDLAAVDPDSEAAGCDWKAILSKVLPYVDFFVPSIEELGYMLDKSLYEKWQRQPGEDDITSALSLKEDVDPLAQKALDMGARAVLLKCGAAGMYLKTVPENAMAKALPMLSGWGDIAHFEDSFVPDRVVSATGAGDTSIGAFLKAMLDGFLPEDCVRYGAATGACCVTAYDAVSGLLDFKALREKMNRGWEKQKLIRP